MPAAADADTDDRWTVLLPSYLDPSGPDSIRDIAEFVSIDDYDSHEALLADAHRFDAILCRTFNVPADLVEAATNLKVISNHGVGLDNVAIDAASVREIPVCNTPGANADAVAEHALALLFAARRQVPRADADVRAGTAR